MQRTKARPPLVFEGDRAVWSGNRVMGCYGWGQLPTGGEPPDGGVPEAPDMCVQWCPLVELLEPFDPDEPVEPVEELLAFGGVELLLDAGALYVDELAVLPVCAVDPVDAACATAAPPIAPAEARTASTVSLRRIGVSFALHGVTAVNARALKRP